MKSMALILTVAGFVLMPAAFPAHHGDAGRYEENVIILTGKVVELQLVDPHAMIVLDVPNEKGQTVRWQAELGGRTGGRIERRRQHFGDRRFR